MSAKDFSTNTASANKTSENPNFDAACHFDSAAVIIEQESLAAIPRAH